MDDVNVLRQACCAFRNSFLKLVEIDPFREAITILSICNKMLLTIFLKPDPVFINPRAGYRMGDRQSVEVPNGWRILVGKGTILLILVMKGRFICLLPNVKFEGYCAETRKVFQYLRCFWNWCQCMPNRHNPIGITNETLLCRYEETQARLQKMRDAGYTVLSTWECEFQKHLCDNPCLQNELWSHHFVKHSPINIRDALYGARTEATKTKYRFKQGKEIRYVDVIRLYPQICLYGKFPVPWGVQGKVVQPNTIFGLIDRLTVHLDQVRMPVGNGRQKTKWRSLGVLGAIKRVLLKCRRDCCA